MILFVLNQSFEILLKFWSSWFLIKVEFFLLQTAQFYKIISLFCLVFLILEFSFAVYFLQLTQHFSIVFIQYVTHNFLFFLSSHYILLTRYLLWLNLSWLIYESIKALEIKNSIVFNLSFPNNTILSCSFFFTFLIDLYFLIITVIAHIFIATTELVKRTRTQTNEANEEI